MYSGVSWSDLDYPSDDLLPDVQDLLLQFRAAAGSAARYASPRSAWLTLGEVSTAFWSLLDQAGRVGLVLVTEKAGPPVVMSERVGVHLDLRSAPDGGLAGVVALPPAEVWAPAELFEATETGDPTFGLVGDPAHGAYWLAAPATPGGAREVVLARLQRPLSTELRRMVEQRSTLEVPAGDRDRFLADFLPALRRAMVPVVTADESIELPTAPVPQVGSRGRIPTRAPGPAGLVRPVSPWRRMASFRHRRIAVELRWSARRGRRACPVDRARPTVRAAPARRPRLAAPSSRSRTARWRPHRAVRARRPASADRGRGRGRDRLAR